MNLRLMLEVFWGRGFFKREWMGKRWSFIEKIVSGSIGL